MLKRLTVFLKLNCFSGYMNETLTQHSWDIQESLLYVSMLCQISFIYVKQKTTEPFHVSLLDIKWPKKHNTNFICIPISYLCVVVFFKEDVKKKINLDITNSSVIVFRQGCQRRNFKDMSWIDFSTHILTLNGIDFSHSN